MSPLHLVTYYVYNWPPLYIHNQRSRECFQLTNHQYLPLTFLQLLFHQLESAQISVLRD